MKTTIVDRNGVRMADKPHFIWNIAKDFRNLRDGGQRPRTYRVLPGREKNYLWKADDQTVRFEFRFQPMGYELFPGAKQTRAGVCHFGGRSGRRRRNKGMRRRNLDTPRGRY
jgi:hypothetical protein